MSARSRLPFLLAVFLPASGALAQAVLTLELGFSNPGARSLGFGGAFVALADDATAAYANPAGLIQLTRPEISIEARSWSYATPFVFGGRASGAPTGLGVDTSPGLVSSESAADFTGLSFLSYVYPHGPWSLAVYRHQAARFASSYATDGLFARGSTFLDSDRWIDRPGSTDLDVVGWGFAAGRRIGDRLSLGIAVTYYRVDMTLGSTHYLPDDDSLEAFFASNSQLPERALLRTSTRAHDSAFAGTLGLLWRISERWSVGVFDRTGFEVRARYAGVPGPASTAESRRQWRFDDGGWTFPSVSGVGGAYTSTDGRLTISFEWDRVRYSEILAGDPDEAVPDADELHLGGEWAFLRRRPVLALRAGAWLDPDHRIRATRGGDLFRAVLSEGNDTMHYAFGLGAAFERFQIDLAADLSDHRDTVSLSAILTF